MFCKRCLEKQKVTKREKIQCKVCGEEVYVSIYNNGKCTKCNVKANTCEECGKPIHV